MGEPSEPTGAILLSEQDELPPTGFFEEVDLSPHRLDQPEVPAAAVAVGQGASRASSRRAWARASSRRCSARLKIHTKGPYYGGS